MGQMADLDDDIVRLFFGEAIDRIGELQPVIDIQPPCGHAAEVHLSDMPAAAKIKVFVSIIQYANEISEGIEK